MNTIHGSVRSVPNRNAVDHRDGENQALITGLVAAPCKQCSNGTSIQMFTDEMHIAMS